MLIEVNNPILQTIIFSLLLFIVCLLGIQKRPAGLPFSPTLTEELKGMAILTVIFSHIGYFLSSNHQFLFPLSVMGGVGVNLFLFLSGFGLTVSQIKNNYSPWQFYKRRLLKLYLPLWLVVVTLIFLDRFILGKIYPTEIMIKNFLGFYPTNNLYQDLDSPLWYFTWIIVYYILYPLLYFRRIPLISPLLIFFVGYSLTKLNLPVSEGVLGFYQLHTWAFPLGMITAVIIKSNLYLRIFLIISKNYQKLPFFISHILRGFLLLLLLGLIAYTAIHSGVGSSKLVEQSTSIITTISIILFFNLFYWELSFLKLIGKYSYEIYLIHWPIMYRFDLLFKLILPGLASFLYLYFFIGIGLLIQKVTLWLASVRFWQGRLETH